MLCHAEIGCFAAGFAATVAGEYNSYGEASSPRATESRAKTGFALMAALRRKDAATLILDRFTSGNEFMLILIDIFLSFTFLVVSCDDFPKRIRTL
jgi:hypothetical protein